MNLNIKNIAVIACLAIVILFFDFAVKATAGNLSQDSSEIIAILKKRDKQIKQLLGPKGTKYDAATRQALKDIINGIIDYNSMAAFALGTTWEKLDSAQKENFVEVFSTIVRDHSLNKLDIYRAEITYEDVIVNGDSAYVKTRAALDNVTTPVSYTMKKKNDGWVVTDFSIDEVSTAESYRRSFQNIIRRKGYQALYDSLKKRAEEAT